MERSIAHIDMDTFFVSCERLQDSRLNGKPILVGGSSNRGVVAACSYEARKHGIHSAMPMKLARQLCPEAIVLRGDMSAYTKLSEIVTEIVKESVPIYEKTSIDEFYLDLTGTDHFFGSYKLVSELRERIIKETGLPLSFGLSINKTVSKIATGEAKPNNKIKIEQGREKDFLAPLSVKKIPMVGKKTYHTLCNLGVKQIKTLQEVPVEMLEQVFGKSGRIMWNKANGIDNTPVIQYSERKSMSKERTFETDTIDVKYMKSIIGEMTESLLFQLRTKKKLTSCVTLKIRYSDFTTQTLQKRIPYSSLDHDILPIAKSLFDKVYSKRLLVRLIGVKFSHLVEGGHQINIFEDNAKMISLYQALDKIKTKYGSKSVVRAFTNQTK